MRLHWENVRYAGETKEEWARRVGCSPRMADFYPRNRWRNNPYEEWWHEVAGQAAAVRFACNHARFLAEIAAFNRAYWEENR